jgi:hypothetical protein
LWQNNSDLNNFDKPTLRSWLNHYALFLNASGQSNMTNQTGAVGATGANIINASEGANASES